MTEYMLEVDPLVLAVALDLGLGDPPNRSHPVARIGSALAPARCGLPTRGKLLPLACGVLPMVTAVAVSFAVDIGVESGFARLHLELTAEPVKMKTMSAAAGALGVEPEKIGHDQLGPGLRRPAASDVGRSIFSFLGRPDWLWGASPSCEPSSFVEDDGLRLADASVAT